ncbi:MAG: universal stress protein [Betaproteobacteria bacterium]
MTHGRGTVGQFLFGSHTQKIVARSKLPVLVLH